MYNSLKGIFSTREIAFLIWLFLFVFLILLFKKSVREPFINVLKAATHRKIIIVFLFMLVYMAAMILILIYIDFWEIWMIKDTLFWFFGFAIVSFFSLNKAENYGYFKSLIKDSVKWILVVEFMVNLYTFSIYIELITFPIITVLALVLGYTEIKKEHESVNKILTNWMFFIGGVYFLYSLYMTIIDFKDVFTVANLNSLLLPVILSMLLVPFLYITALIFSYETLFLRVKFSYTGKVDVKDVKKRILITANLNLNRVYYLTCNFNKINFQENNSYKNMIRNAARKEINGIKK